MTLPKINTPEYTLVIPSTDEEIKFRPFLVKEEKLLLIAQETADDAALYRAIKNLISECCFGKVDADKLPLFDIEYIFLQIRAKSVDEIAKIQVTCPDDNETKVEIEVDLTKLKVEMPKGHNSKIQLTDDIGIMLSYPNLASVMNVGQVVENAEKSEFDTMFGMVSDCIYQIWQGEEVFDVLDYSDKDKKAFLDSLNHDQFGKIQNFFETMPTLKHEAEVTNPKTGVNSKVVLEGMNSFF